MPLATRNGTAHSTPAPGTPLALPKIGAASSRSPKHASRRSQSRLHGSTSRLIGSITSSRTSSCGTAAAGCTSLDGGGGPACAGDVAFAGTLAAMIAALAVTPPSGSNGCSCIGCADGPTCLRIAFSVRPSRPAISRLLLPSAFIRTMMRARVAEMRRRPRRQPERVASAAMPPTW